MDRRALACPAKVFRHRLGGTSPPKGENDNKYGKCDFLCFFCQLQEHGRHSLWKFPILLSFLLTITKIRSLLLPNLHKLKEDLRLNCFGNYFLLFRFQISSSDSIFRKRDCKNLQLNRSTSKEFLGSGSNYETIFALLFDSITHSLSPPTSG